jgi:hypothetical protein
MSTAVANRALRAKLQWLFWPLLTLSFVMGAVSVWRLMGGGTMTIVMWIGYAWLGLFVLSLVLFRRRGLWFLTSMPFAFGPAALIVVYLASCMAEKACI